MLFRYHKEFTHAVIKLTRDGSHLEVRPVIPFRQVPAGELSREGQRQRLRLDGLLRHLEQPDERGVVRLLEEVDAHVGDGRRHDRHPAR